MKSMLEESKWLSVKQEILRQLCKLIFETIAFLEPV